MLARHAEDLFWIGRYLERTENTARMLDVTFHAALEAGDRTAADTWAELLEVLFLEEEAERQGIAPSEQVGVLLLADPAQEGSIPWSIARARDNARTAREWLSSETWEAINSLHLDLGGTDLAFAARQRPYDVTRTVRAGCHAVSGAAQASMPRGEGHRFFVCGQVLERAAIITRALAVWQRRLGLFTAHAAYTEWVKLLRSVSAYEAYLRDFQAAMDPGTVLEFLVGSREFPRSVLHCLTAAEAELSALADHRVGHGARRAAGRVRARVEFVEPHTLSGQRLGEFLDTTEAEILELSERVADDYFRPGSSMAMHAYEVF